MIEEFEERFALEDCDKMLSIIAKALPRDDDEEMEEGGEEEDVGAENA